MQIEIQTNFAEFIWMEFAKYLGLKECYVRVVEPDGMVMRCFD
jgi:hypothetical protein